MKYDFETIIDRDPAIRGTGKYRIMKDSKGNKPPKGIVPLSVADMEFRTAPCVIDAIKAEADFGVLGYHRLTDSFRESCCQWMKTRHDWDVQPDWIVPFEQVAIKAEADFGVLGYHRLTDSFRESCCQWMKTRHDWDVQPDWIVPFEQVVPALYNAVWTFTQPGDGILIQTPDYHHFTGATVNTGRKVLENRLVADEKGHYTVDFDDFREKAKQAKLFFLCSPQNPTGRVWTEEELRRMGTRRATIPWISTTSVRRPSRPSCSSSAPPRILPAASGRRRSCAGWARSATSTASWWWPTRSTTI